jgi:hypothetical protein
MTITNLGESTRLLDISQEDSLTGSSSSESIVNNLATSILPPLGAGVFPIPGEQERLESLKTRSITIEIKPLRESNSSSAQKVIAKSPPILRKIFSYCPEKAFLLNSFWNTDESISQGRWVSFHHFLMRQSAKKFFAILSKNEHDTVHKIPIDFPLTLQSYLNLHPREIFNILELAADAATIHFHEFVEAVLSTNEARILISAHHPLTSIVYYFILDSYIKSDYEKGLTSLIKKKLIPPRMVSYILEKAVVKSKIWLKNIAKVASIFHEPFGLEIVFAESFKKHLESTKALCESFPNYLFRERSLRSLSYSPTHLNYLIENNKITNEQFEFLCFLVNKRTLRLLLSNRALPIMMKNEMLLRALDPLDIDAAEIILEFEVNPQLKETSLRLIRAFKKQQTTCWIFVFILFLTLVLVIYARCQDESTILS